MNYSVVRFILFKVIMLVGILMSLPLIVALIYREELSAGVFLGLMIGCIVVGIIGSHFKPKKIVLYAKEGFVITALSWIIISLIGAVPFVLTGTIPSYVDAVFETISGFTTTGASILPAAGGLEYSVQFWRTFSHWIGGMGVLVFMIAVIPLADGSGMHIMRAESPGPSVGKIVPKIKDTARTLYLIYFLITMLEVICLMITGLDIYSALTITFSTVGTGGFAITNAGIGGYSLMTQTVIIVFMALCGVNFSVYYYISCKKFGEAFKIDEVKWYFITMFGAATLIAINVYRAGLLETPYLSFHHALFAVTSIMTTTGFGTEDFNLWPQFSRTLIVTLTMIGACAGSTGGGFKFSRFIILWRTIKNELIFIIHPKSVKKVYMDGRAVEGTTVKSVSAYLGIYVLIYVVSLLIISLDGFDYETNFTAVAATLNNVGPGLGMVGPMGNYSEFSVLSKIVLMFDMLAGRLELLPIMILLSPRTWKKL